MTPEELDGCLALLQAYYPGDWTPERQAVWADQFVNRNLEDVRAALSAMASNSEFASAAAFTAAFQGVRRRREAENGRPALPPSTVDSSRMFAALRAVFAVTNDGHDHRKGPENCPTCKLHDVETHRRDRVSSVAAGCPRCHELAQVFLEAAEV